MIDGVNKKFALKCVPKEKVFKAGHQSHIIEERAVLEMSDSPFIVNHYRTFRDTRQVYFLMDICLGGDLMKMLKKYQSLGMTFSEKQVKFYAANVIEAIDYLHFCNILYRDMKPENLLLDRNGYRDFLKF